ncbi:hypothetical protein BG006_011458 [Podila minutissima]|uniref:F-box domain-containing protein n=3 Tax=Mortierellaceae TaxID=4854 RepID=A0A9P5SS57_9FUNG|nr:hypothetical protein BG006_011458 [Podila minutissima]
MAEANIHHHTRAPGPVTKLAPEIILHILSFLDYTDHPSRLLPILTLNKLWARLALVLLYEQPVLTMAQCTLLARTLQLQDRIDGKIFWDPSFSPDKACDTEYHLNIDYTRLIKKPCRIVGPIAPTKQDLIQLWEIQLRLWNSPVIKQAQASEPSSPTSLPSPPQSPPLPFDSSKPSSRPSSPSPNKVVMVRRKKKQELPGPTVMLLDQPCVMTDTTEAILGQALGLKLSQLHVQWLLRTPIINLVKSNITTLETFSLTKSPMHPAALLELAHALGDRPEPDKNRGQGLKSLKLEDCPTINRSVLSAFVESCASTLEVLEIREAVRIRVMGDHAIFPLDGPGDWNPESPAVLTDTQHNYLRLGTEEHCVQCGSRGKDQCQEADVENHIEALAIAESSEPSPPTPTPQVDNQVPPLIITAADQNSETRIDLSLLEFAEGCRHLQEICLHRITWLSDQVLAGFRPSPEAGEQRGLRAIEIVDSYYGSSVTIEGLLEICGPRLESLVLDRKSCWRVRPNTDQLPSPLCSECHVRESTLRAIEKNRATGDRILRGLLHKKHGLRLKKLVLMEHWVTSQGKVHGSLARAGKVKSQTPKVAKQEKKKKLTGRAKKRDTYKRRFVNVTNAPGGKRRMNVNPESTKN